MHWSPSQIEEWLNSDMEMIAVYYGSTLIKIEHDKKEAEEIKRKNKPKGKRR